MSSIEVHVDPISGDVAIEWADTPGYAVVSNKFGEIRCRTRTVLPTGMTRMVTEDAALDAIRVTATAACATTRAASAVPAPARPLPVAKEA